MASSSLRCSMALALLVVLVVLGHGGIIASNADGLCNMTTDDLEACKPAVSGSSPANPSPECCAGLAKADLQCLCSYRDSVLLPALGIDPDLAMQLPAKCKLSPPDNC